jgi:hypothetical protein
MSNRFPPLRPQVQQVRPAGRALPAPAPVDVVLLAALVLMIGLALF